MRILWVCIYIFIIHAHTLTPLYCYSFEKTTTKKSIHCRFVQQVFIKRKFLVVLLAQQRMTIPKTGMRLNATLVRAVAFFLRELTMYAHYVPWALFKARVEHRIALCVRGSWSFGFDFEIAFSRSFYVLKIKFILVPFFYIDSFLRAFHFYHLFCCSYNL